MAEIKNKLFGELSGKFGDIVYRQRNGKNYISRRPKTYSTPQNESFVERSNKFKMSSRIAAVINSVDALKNIWENVKPPNISVYNYLISKNYNASGVNSLLGNMIIVPNSEVGVRLASSEIQADKLIIALEPLTESARIDPTIEKKIQIILVLFMDEPINTNLPSFNISSMISVQKDFDLTTSISFEVMIPTSVSEKMNQYQNKNAFATVVTFDENNTLIKHSDSFTINLSN